MISRSNVLIESNARTRKTCNHGAWKTIKTHQINDVWAVIRINLNICLKINMYTERIRQPCWYHICYQHCKLLFDFINITTPGNSSNTSFAPVYTYDTHRKKTNYVWIFVYLNDFGHPSRNSHQNSIEINIECGVCAMHDVTMWECECVSKCLQENIYLAVDGSSCKIINMGYGIL